MNVALVYDRVNKWGGAERVLLALHEIWRDAPLFTAVYDKKKATWAKVFTVHPSFLQKFPFAKNAHEYLAWITPIAFETFNFDAFDVVISVTSAEAKNIITKPGTRHICYCLTPTRYLWSARQIYEKSGITGKVLQVMAPTLRNWDQVAGSRPDTYIAISDAVRKRIKRYYHRDARVIYPPVDTDKFKSLSADEEGQKSLHDEEYFLTVSRLVRYKRVDSIVDAFNELGWKLKIVGTGSDEAALKERAKKNIEFVGGDLTDTELVTYYQECSAFVFAGDEDFGLVSLEAQACGKPVLCPRNSGMAETVIEGITGELFDDEILPALQKFKRKRYDSHSCRQNAERFSTERFKKEMKETVERLSI